MQPARVHVLGLWIFQNKLIKNQIRLYPMRQIEVTHASDFKIDRRALAMLAARGATNGGIER